MLHHSLCARVVQLSMITLIEIAVSECGRNANVQSFSNRRCAFLPIRKQSIKLAFPVEVFNKVAVF